MASSIARRISASALVLVATAVIGLSGSTEAWGKTSAWDVPPTGVKTSAWDVTSSPTGAHTSAWD